MRGLWCALLMLALAVGGLAADEGPIESSRRLAAEGRHAEALRLLDGVLEREPGSVEALLLKGVVLAEIGRFQEAEQVFLDLTRRAPEHPEPLNNLAVLYSRKGEYEAAAAVLEQALGTRSSYGTAYQNLIKVRGRQAGRAYDRALGQESAPTAGGPRLEWLAQIDSVRSSTEAAVDGAANPVAGPGPAPVDEPLETAATRADELPPSEPPAEPISEFDAAGVVEMIQAWAGAWSEQRADDYLAFYSQSFVPHDGSTRSSWAAERRRQVLAPSAIQVELESIGVRQLGQDEAQARFVESYTSNGTSRRAAKTLDLVREAGGWKIRGESSNRR